MDRMSRERRSWNMGRIRSRDTAPEVAVRSALHRLGFRFRVHAKALPGKPDIVLPKWKHAIFVHGCFWHRHGGCKMAFTPKTRTDFWLEKFARNIARDQKAQRELERLGWSVSVIWECEISDSEALSARIQKVADWITRPAALDGS